MTLRQQSKIAMLMVLTEYLSQNTAIVNTIPNLAGLITQLKTLISQIQAQSEQQIINHTGVAVAKKEARINLVGVAADVARKLSAYALMDNNDNLLKEVRISDSVLSRMADEKLKEVCQLIYDRALANVQPAAQYGVNNPLLTSLLNAIDTFNAIIPKPRLSATEKKQATTQLTKLFVDVEVILEKVDMLVDIVKSNQVIFYSGFKSARMIVDRVGRGYILKVTILDASDNQPLKGVACKIIIEQKSATSKESAINKRTALKGSFYIKSMPEGTFNMSIAKSGYKSINQVLNISKNEFVNLNINLEKS
jgi:hypothetical protein